MHVYMTCVSVYTLDRVSCLPLFLAYQLRASFSLTPFPHRDSVRKELEQARQQAEEERSQWGQRELRLLGEKEDLHRQVQELEEQLASAKQEIAQVCIAPESCIQAKGKQLN